MKFKPAIKARRRRGESDYYRGIRTGFGTKGATYVPMGVGFVFGVLGDFLYNSFGLPGYDQRNAACNSMSVGDVIQLGALAALTFLGFVTKNWMFPSFFFGAMTGSLTPKLLAASDHPRYGLFDFNQDTGAIAPLGKGLRGAYPTLDNIGKTLGITPKAPKKNLITKSV